MAMSFWGKVYYQLADLAGGPVDVYAGELRQEPGGRCVFTYDPNYLANPSARPIAHLMPLREPPYISEFGLHPFFDNLVAEGWLCNAQARSLGVNPNNRFALILGYGHDLVGAVSVVDPEPQKRRLNHEDEVTNAALASRASLSGIQRKFFVVKEGTRFRPAHNGETSTHIAKLPSGNLTNIIELEFITTQAVRVLLPDDEVVELQIAPVQLKSSSIDALVVRRFDRRPSGAKIHFEEFNQLFGNQSGDDKYNGTYEQMGTFVRTTPGCVPAEAEQLFRRILASLLVGNTDAHFKNFAMFHTRDGLRLTPSYDLVAASNYPEYQTIAMSAGGARDLRIGNLKAKHLISLADGFGLSGRACQQVIKDLESQIPKAKAAVEGLDVGAPALISNFIKRIDKRWNGSFASIGPLLSRRQNSGEKNKN